MGKFKPARGRKAAAGPKPNAAGCIFLLVLIFAVIFAALYLAVGAA